MVIVPAIQCYVDADTTAVGERTDRETSEQQGTDSAVISGAHVILSTPGNVPKRFQLC